MQRKRTATRLVLGVLPCLAAAGCTVGPDFLRPALDAPARWSAQRTDVASVTAPTAIDTTWWRSFGDPVLVSLVEQLAAQNLDLKTAAERIVQARDQREIAAAQGLPNVSGSVLATHNRLSTNGILQLVQPAPGASPEFDLFQHGLSASWELDLFGKVRRAVEAQDANTAAAVEVRHGIALAGIAELAQDYVQLRSVQANREITAQSLVVADQNVKLVYTRIANGYATTLDLAQAQAQRLTVAELLPNLDTQQAALINAIGLLLAMPPRALEAELAPSRPQPQPPPVVAVGLPGTLVRQRPDVREAEARLHAATAQTGVAVAEFYPDVTLIGAANFQSLEIRDAFNIASRSFDIGPSISIPIFEGGRLRGQLDLRKSQEREAALQFQETVLQAWRDVDNALTAYAQAQHRRDQSAGVVAQNEVVLRAARQQYAQGLADFLNVNTAQSQLLQSRVALANATAQVNTGLVTLYRALGGGWEATDVLASNGQDLQGSR